MDARSVYWYRIEFALEADLFAGVITEDKMHTELDRIKHMNAEQLEAYCEEHNIPGDEALGGW